jgi:hypothetical protein
MRHFILFFAFIALSLTSCTKDPNPNPAQSYPFPGSYTGQYTVQSSAVVAPQSGVATVTDAGGSNYQVVLTIGANQANLTATLGADNRLSFAQQNVFGMSVTGTGEMTNSGNTLNIVFTSSGQVTTTGATFRGNK